MYVCAHEVPLCRLKGGFERRSTSRYGWPDLAVWRHNSAHDGDQLVFQFDGKRYKAIACHRVSYQNPHGKPNLTPTYSPCLLSSRNGDAPRPLPEILVGDILAAGELSHPLTNLPEVGDRGAPRWTAPDHSIISEHRPRVLAINNPPGRQPGGFWQDPSSPVVEVVVMRPESAADEKAPAISIGRISIIAVGIVGCRCIISPSRKWNSDADKDPCLGRSRSQGHGAKAQYGNQDHCEMLEPTVP